MIMREGGPFLGSLSKEKTLKAIENFILQRKKRQSSKMMLQKAY